MGTERGSKTGVFSLEFNATIGAPFDVVTHFRVTLGAYCDFHFRIHHQAALRALGGPFWNGSRTRRANTLKLLFLVPE